MLLLLLFLGFACHIPLASCRTLPSTAQLGPQLWAVGVVGVTQVKIGFLMAKQKGNGTKRNGMEQRQRFATFCVSNGAEDELRERERE